MDWCQRNHLQINAGGRLRSWWWTSAGVNIPHPHGEHPGVDIESVDSYRYLGLHINNTLDCSGKTCKTITKAHLIHVCALFSQKCILKNRFHPGGGSHVGFLNFDAFWDIFELHIQQIWIQHPLIPLEMLYIINIHIMPSAL